MSYIYHETAGDCVTRPALKKKKKDIFWRDEVIQPCGQRKVKESQGVSDI